MRHLAVDINCDMGESFGAYKMGDDSAIMPYITSANVACGFHAGDPRVMQKTVELAKRYNVSVGAHPGFPDLVGFGRRNLGLTPEEARTDVLYQIGALMAIARAHGTRLRHVKPHGQLNNLSVTDPALAAAIAGAVRDVDSSLVLIAYGGALKEAGERAGLRVAQEAYADRAYQADGTLVPRSRPGAVITDPEQIVARAIRMVRDQEIVAITGERIPFKVDTLCVHGDTPGAAAIARRLREGLAAAGVAVAPLV